MNAVLTQGRHDKPQTHNMRCIDAIYYPIPMVYAVCCLHIGATDAIIRPALEKANPPRGGDAKPRAFWRKVAELPEGE